MWFSWSFTSSATSALWKGAVPDAEKVTITSPSYAMQNMPSTRRLSSLGSRKQEALRLWPSIFGPSRRMPMLSNSSWRKV